MTSFLAALRLLTILPAPMAARLTARQYGGSAVYFPLVGLVLGLILFGLDWLLSRFFAPLVVDSLLVAALAVLTGGMHLDGFLDTCDGVACRSTSEERLRVMAQGTVGGIAVVGGIILLLIKFSALSALNGDARGMALIAMPVVSRWTMVHAIAFFPYARQSGMGLPFKENTGPRELIIATLLTALVAGVAFRLAALPVMIVSWLVALGIARFLSARLKGLTGDSYGAINEVVEVCVLVMVPLAWGLA